MRKIFTILAIGAALTGLAQPIGLPLNEEGMMPQRQVYTVSGQLTPDDFIGMYRWSGTNCLEEEFWDNYGIINIAKDTENPEKLQISGLASAYTLRGCYIENDRLYVPNQYLNVPEYNMETWFWNQSLRNGVDKDGKKSYYYVTEPGTEFYLTLGDSGEIYAGTPIDPDKWKDLSYTDEELLDMVCIGSGLDFKEGSRDAAHIDGSYWMCRFIAGEKHDFVFDESEWKSVGAAEFKDAWFPNFWGGDEVVPYEVPLYRSYSDENVYLLYNPYGPDSPYGGDVNASSEPGYIVFDITNPDCVVFNPFTYVVSFYFGNEDQPDVRRFNTYNTEGWMFYFADYGYGDIAEVFKKNEWKMSYFDQAKRCVWIENAAFSYVNGAGEIFTRRAWKNYSMKGYIKLPDVFNSEVEDMLLDKAIDQTEYYNLQGVRLVNPEKGQPVIVRRGSKATKQIFR